MDVSLLIQYLVHASLHQKMEESHSTLILVVGSYRVELWLPTVVNQATLLLVTQLEPVSLVHGLVVIQFAKVLTWLASSNMCIQFLSLYRLLRPSSTT